MEYFLTKALEICGEKGNLGGSSLESQEHYNRRVCHKISKVAEEQFTHRHPKILRLLIDLLFIPFGLLGLGAPFAIKYFATESPTFFLGKKKTFSHQKLDEFLDGIDKPSETMTQS